MKKFSYYLMTLLVSIMFMACSGCKQQTVPALADTVRIDSTVFITLPVVENFVSTDREEMFLHYAKDYRWYETQIVFKDYLDNEDVSDTVESITDVFQYVVEEDSSFDTYVVQMTHLADTSLCAIDHSFWIEDFPLEDGVIKLTFSEALGKIYEVNAPKPHSRKCTLRIPIGPLSCNPQYIFGNMKAQLWVDAVTGEVRTSNPAFPDEVKLTMPLGEWP